MKILVLNILDHARRSKAAFRPPKIIFLISASAKAEREEFAHPAFRIGIKRIVRNKAGNRAIVYLCSIQQIHAHKFFFADLIPAFIQIALFIYHVAIFKFRCAEISSVA